MRTVDKLIDELIAIREAYSGELPVTYGSFMSPDYDELTCTIRDVNCYDNHGKSPTQGDDVEPTHVFLL